MVTVVVIRPAAVDCGLISGGSTGRGDVGADDESVSVDINGMLDFYQEMQNVQGDTNEATIVVSELTPLIHSGLNTPGRHGEVFPEGALWASIMLERQHQFASFLADVSTGILSIASASAVIAEMYGDGDFHSSVDINDVAFAFGDRGATPPDGFREFQTWSEYRAEQRGNGYPMALMGDRSSARHEHLASGVDLYLFPDGSSIQVVTTTRPDGTRVSETTIFGPPGSGDGRTRAVLEKTTVEASTDEDGKRTETTTVVTGTEENGTTSTTTRETTPDGRITIRNSTSTVVDGLDPIVTEADPVVVEPGEHVVEQSEPGPIAEAMEVLQPDWDHDDDYAQEYGHRP